MLAEANQWPSDVRPYFGDGDECHMAFHFPLMPRMYVAIRQEDRTPIVEIMRQTPEIPDSCQWGLFLRNHDELTLEMVTHDERDYMYLAYSATRACGSTSASGGGWRRCWITTGSASSCSTACCIRFPERRSCTTATRSAWETTSIWATAMACARRCSGMGSRMPAFQPRRPASFAPR